MSWKLVRLWSNSFDSDMKSVDEKQRHRRPNKYTTDCSVYRGYALLEKTEAFS